MQNTLSRRAATTALPLLVTGAFAAPPPGWPNQAIKEKLAAIGRQK